MTPIDKITNDLEKLQGHAYFKVQEGALRDTLVEALAEVEDAAPLGVSAKEGEVEITLKRGDDGNPVLSVRLDDSGESRCCDLAVTRLAGSALEEISRHLAEKAAAIPATEEGDADHYTIGAASNRMRVSMAWLKSVIPCTYYTYEEIDGRKKIKEYFWSKELIAILHQLRHKKPTPQDVQFIADHCCEGDVTWSKEIIARLKSYNRPEPPPKEARAQQRPAKAPQRQGGNEGEKGRKPERQHGRH